jgi:transposase
MLSVIKKTLALAERTFRCDDCGFEEQRDVNAAAWRPARPRQPVENRALARLARTG